MAAGQHDFFGYLTFQNEYRATYGNVAARYVFGGVKVGAPLAFIRKHCFYIGSIERLDLLLHAPGGEFGTRLNMRRDARQPRWEHPTGPSLNASTAAISRSMKRCARWR
ncbi:MAG: hypothetical protein EXR01_02425 [Acetobacteraceae bacterium]|nr:hypothetical protein [Acetobacteraceae bacterium]